MTFTSQHRLADDGPHCVRCGKVFPCQGNKNDARIFAEASAARARIQWGPEVPRPVVPAPGAGGSDS